MVRGRGVLRARIDRDGARSGSGTSRRRLRPPRELRLLRSQHQQWRPQGVIIEQVLVKVNGDIITKTELEERQIAALRERKVSPEVLKNDEQLKKALADVTPQLLVNAIDELLVMQLGREKGLRLSDEQFNRWLTTMRKDQNLEDDKKFEAALQQEGMTLTDIRRNVEKQFLLAAGAERGVRRQAADHRRRGAAVLPGEPEGVRRARDRHAARDPHRSADDDAAGPDDGQRRQR